MEFVLNTCKNCLKEFNCNPLQNTCYFDSNYAPDNYEPLTIQKLRDLGHGLGSINSAANKYDGDLEKALVYMQISGRPLHYRNKTVEQVIAGAILEIDKSREILF
jgi:hypothetical protein